MCFRQESDCFPYCGTVVTAGQPQRVIFLATFKPGNTERSQRKLYGIFKAVYAATGTLGKAAGEWDLMGR